MKKTIVLMLALALLAGCASNDGISDRNQTQNESSIGTTDGILDAGGSVIQNNSIPDQLNSSNSSEYDFSKTYSDDGKLMIYFFYSSTCNACKSIGPYVESIGRKYENQTQWKGFDIRIKGDREVYYEFYRKMNLTQNQSGVPVMLINNTILWGKYEINDSLEKVIIEAAH